MMGMQLKILKTIFKTMLLELLIPTHFKRSTRIQQQQQQKPQYTIDIKCFPLYFLFIL